MLSLGDDIPALAICSTACADLDRGQIGPKVAGQFIDEQTLAVRGLKGWSDMAGSLVTRGSYLDLDVRKGPGRCVITLLGFLKRGLIQRGHGS